MQWLEVLVLASILFRAEMEETTAKRDSGWKVLCMLHSGCQPKGCTARCQLPGAQGSGSDSVHADLYHQLAEEWKGESLGKERESCALLDVS